MAEESFSQAFARAKSKNKEKLIKELVNNE